jgi:hypothetical protein
LMAVVQVFTAAILTLILLVLLGLVFTMNPDLEAERDQIVTPVMRWLASWIFAYGTIATWFLKVYLVVFVAGLGLFLARGSLVGTKVPESGEDRTDASPDQQET